MQRQEKDSLYKGYFYFIGFANPSQGAEAANGVENEASGACWVTHTTSGSGTRGRGQAQSQELAS